jgi:hypothetical protein
MVRETWQQCVRIKERFECEHSACFPFDRVLYGHRLYSALSSATVSVIGNVIFVNCLSVPLFSSITCVHSDRQSESPITIELQHCICDWKIIRFRKYNEETYVWKLFLCTDRRRHRLLCFCAEVTCSISTDSLISWKLRYVRTGALVAVVINVTVCQGVTLRSLVDVYRRFGATY